MLSSLLTLSIGFLDGVLSSLGLPSWFRHAYFEYHVHVRLRFRLASGLGEPWTRDGGIPQGCPLSMMVIVDLYLPWFRYLANQEGFSLSCMLIILNVFPGTLLGSCALVYHWLCSVGWSGACSKYMRPFEHFQGG